MKRTWDLGLGIWVLGFVVALLPSGAAGQDMPDPSLIHGRAIPAPELPAGTVTIRVVREAIGNNIAGQQVRVTVGGATQIATTDDLGRAEFKDLPRGGEARAEATVDGETLASQPFTVPVSGGLRVILVAGLKTAAERRAKEEAEAAAAPPTKGAVVLGPNSRIIMEFNNDALFAFYVFEIVNNARTRVDIGGPIVIDLPEDAISAAVEEGSTPSATVNGRRLTIEGPFASGATPVQVRYHFAYRSRNPTIVQSFPIAMQQVTVGVEKVGDLTMASPQFNEVGDIRVESGEAYVVGRGGALPAGTPLTINLSNLPLHSPTPRYVALAIALALVGLSVWLSMTARRTRVDEHQALVKRRDALLEDLAKLESQRRAGSIAAERYDARRRRLLTELEQIYGQLDEEASSGPQGGGEGLAA